MVKILCVEGQRVNPFAPNSFIYDELVEPFMKRFGNVVRDSVEWNSNLSTTGGVDIVIGHSLGGNRAIDLVNASRVKPKALLLLDPRWMSNLGWLGVVGLGYIEKSKLPNFTAPVGVPTYNFYHQGPLMPGYYVNSAITNTVVQQSHLNVPGDPSVFQCLRGLVGV